MHQPMKVGLFGGSFDPPHQGHEHVANLALKDFDLHQVWMIPSAGNPLKHRKPSKIDFRIEKLKSMESQRLKVKDFEKIWSIRGRPLNTWEIIERLKRKHREHSFIWIMGSDSLMDFHNWIKWETIVNRVPLAVYSRPGYDLKALRSKTAIRLQWRKTEKFAIASTGYKPNLPRWAFLKTRTLDLSSTSIRMRNA